MADFLGPPTIEEIIALKQTPSAGDAILWKGDGWFFWCLSFLLMLKDSTWRARWFAKDRWLPWHTGFVIRILDTGEIVTFQAVNLEVGVCAVTYATKEDMGDCRTYHWLDSIDVGAMNRYVDTWNGRPYDILAYPEVAFTILFNWHFVINDDKLMCWENLCNFMRCMGKELNPLWQVPLISRIMNKLEGK